MSTNSHYYKSASHYPSTPTSNHEHHYGLGPTWQDANQDSPAGPLPAGVGPSFNHYAQAGGHSVTANNSTIPSWPSGYDRQIVPPWTQQGYGQSYGARSSNSYPPTENASANRHDPAVTNAYHQQHQELNTEPKVPLTTPVNAYRDVNRFSTSMASPATVVDPPFSNHDHGPQPLSRQSQSLSRASPPDTTTTLPPRTSHAAWEPPQEYPVQAESKFVTSAATAGHLAPTAFWAGLDAVVPAIEPVAYGRVPEIRHSWGHIPTQQHEQPQYVQQQVANDGFTNPADQAAVYTRPPGRKKVPKVPSSFVERQEKQKISKRKGPLQEGLREKTHKMRKVKRICVRCRFYKSGCDCGDPCEKCLKTIGHARSFHEPCFREHLEDASLVRHCNGREHQQVAEFLNYEWLQDSNLYDMEIVWNLPGYGPIPNAQPLQLVFRPYAPKKALDVAASVWTNNRGQVTQLEQPAYAIYDTASLVSAFEGYFSGLQPAIERWIYDRVQSDEIACLTYREVARMRSTHGSKVLDLAMKMQCLSVVSQGYGSVWSNNIPGIREYDYSSLGRSDYEAYDRHTYDRPLPGAMAHQMDVAAVKYLAKLEKAITKELVALIFKPKIKPWYELFLAFYVIFWNLNYIQHGAHDYIKSKNGTLMENQVSNVVTNQIEKWEWAVPVILYHWRCILRGYSPFKLARDNPEELRERGHIDPEGFDYVTRISEIFDKNNPDRSQPPQTGFASNHWSGSSQCIMDLFKMSGA